MVVRSQADAAWRTIRTLSLTAAATLFVGCAPGGDHLAIVGGGFQFNYRIAEMSYQLVAELQRPLPEGARAEAEFENPAGGAPIRVAEPQVRRERRLGFSSPPVLGVRKDRPYRVTLRLLDGEGRVIETHDTSFTSDIDGSVMPGRPLTVGPGYQQNITGTTEAFPLPATPR